MRGQDAPAEEPVAVVLERLLSHQPAVGGEGDPERPADDPFGAVVVARGEFPDEFGPGAVPAGGACLLSGVGIASVEDVGEVHKETIPLSKKETSSERTRLRTSALSLGSRSCPRNFAVS
jgi:hypothetical protein